MAWRGVLDRPGDRSGLRSREHPRGGRISERTGLQVGRGLSVRARTALFRPADDRSRRRNAEGGARHQSIRRLADEESLGAPVPPTGRLPIEVRCT
jgi:hypothetical protein